MTAHPPAARHYTEADIDAFFEGADRAAANRKVIRPGVESVDIDKIQPLTDAELAQLEAIGSMTENGR